MGSSDADDPGSVQAGADFETELAERLLRSDLDPPDLERARKVQERRGCGLTTVLLDLGLVAEERLRALRTEILGPSREPSDQELISQTSFERIYQEGAAVLPPSGRSAPLRPGEVRAPVERELAPLTPEGEAAAPPAASPAPAVPVAPAPAPPVPAAAAPPAPEPRAEEPWSEELDLVETVCHWHGDASREIRPVDELAEAKRMLAAATDREQVGWILARHALGKAPRVVLLGRRGRAWVGWAGAGRGIRSERVSRLVVPPVPGTVFGLVANTGAHYLGPLAPHPVHERFFRTLDVPPAASVGLFPVHHEGSIEMALYVDAGPGGQLDPDVGEVLLVAMEAPRILARLAAGAAS